MAAIENDRDTQLRLRGVNSRIMNPSIDIVSTSSPTGYSYFTKPTNNTVLTPASITLTANATSVTNPGSYTNPTYKWEYSTSSDPVTWINLNVSTYNLVLTNSAFFGYVGSGNNLNIKITVSQAGWSTLEKVYVLEYYRAAIVPPIVTISRESITVPSSTLGVLNYSTTGTDIRVSINNLYIPYDIAGTAGPNTFTVTTLATTASAVSNPVTVGAVSTVTTTVTNDTRRFGNISNLGVSTNPASITYTIVVRDADGLVTTYNRIQNIVVSLTGDNAKVVGINAESYVFKADSNNTIVNSTIKLTATKQNTSAAVTWSTEPSVNLYTQEVGGTLVTVNYPAEFVYMRSSDYGTNTFVKVFCNIVSENLSDTCSIARVRDGSYGITARLTNPNAPLPTTNTGDITYTASGTNIQVYEGSALLIITDCIPVATNIISGVVAGLNTTTVTIADHNSINANTAKIVYNLTVTRGDGTSETTAITQSLYKSIQGTDGNKLITVSIFKWSNTPITSVPSTAATYTWPSPPALASISTKPTGWEYSAVTAPGTGYTLYQANLIIKAAALAVSTAINWADATLNTIGYRQDGSIGPQGESHRTAYVVTTSGTVPGTVTSGVGNEPPTNIVSNQVTPWSFAATSVLQPGQYMYQVDGIYNDGTAFITWGSPYLSNLKVGSLSAITADLGTVSISSTGKLSTKDLATNLIDKTYASTQAGIFIGYDVDNYKVNIGGANSYLKWDGGALDIKGAITATSGSFTGDITANNGTFAGVVNASSGNFTGNIYADNGYFHGSIEGATGEFAGTLRAGVINFTDGQGASITLGPGTHYLTVPVGKNRVKASLQGAGGGGGGGTSRYYMHTIPAGGGGGAGATVTADYTVAAGTVLTITVGTGGTAGYASDGTYSVGGNGGGGGNTTLVGYGTAPGGSGGNSAYYGGAGGAGGYVAAANSFSGIAGNSGSAIIGSTGSSNGKNENTATYGPVGGAGGNGGNSKLGSGGTGGIGNSSTQATAATGYGAGGGGGGGNSSNNSAGYTPSAGGNGRAIIQFFDANTVVLLQTFNELTSALLSQGIAVS